MSDSIPPKKHDLAAWGALIFMILMSWAGIIASYAVNRERVDTLTDEHIDHEHRIRICENNAQMNSRLEDIVTRLVRVETQVGAVSVDVKELKDRKR